MRMLSTLAALVASTLAGAAAASPPRLVDSKPADGALATRPAAIRLAFDQKVVAAGASYELLMVTMPGMAMAEPMRMAVVSGQSDPDGAALYATLKGPLPPGGYKINWRVKNAAGEEGAGTLSFAVR
jgi:methionine-rich copper-binding protein CopC